MNLHVGSSGTSPSTTDDAPPDVIGVLFFAYAMFAAVDWLYSTIPVRFPDIKICLSEGGIGWVPACSTGSTTCCSYHEMYGTWNGDRADAGRGVPAQLLVLRGRGPVVVRAARAHRRRQHPARVRLPALRLDVAATRRRSSSDEIGGLPADDIRKITWENASRLYRHPVPPEVQADPDAF